MQLVFTAEPTILLVFDPPRLRSTILHRRVIAAIALFTL